MFYECYDKNGNYIGRASSEEGAKNLTLQANLLIEQKEEAERIRLNDILQAEEKLKQKQQRKEEKLKQRQQRKERRRVCRQQKIEEMKSFFKKYGRVMGISVLLICMLTFLIMPSILYGDIYGPNTTYFDKVKRIFYWVSPDFEIPEHATEIGYRAFEDCEQLTSVTIPIGVTRIDDWAFRDCRRLQHITIPLRVAYIGRAAFDGCNSLEVIDCHRLVPPKIAYKKEGYWRTEWETGSFPFNSDLKIYVPRQYYDEYIKQSLIDNDNVGQDKWAGYRRFIKPRNW